MTRYKHVFVSMCTPTAQLTDLAKEALPKEVGYGIVRIGDLSVYGPDDTPQHKLTMENVVYGGKIASTRQTSMQVVVQRCGLTSDRKAAPRPPVPAHHLHQPTVL